MNDYSDSHPRKRKRQKLSEAARMADRRLVSSNAYQQVEFLVIGDRLVVRKRYDVELPFD